MKRLIAAFALLVLVAFPAAALARIQLRTGKTRVEIIKASGAKAAQYHCYRVYLAARRSPWAIQTTTY